MTLRFGLLRRFRFNLPQRIAAGLLALFLLQGLWLTGRQTLTDRDYQYARCGRETWERPSPLAGYFTSCGNIHDGILAYRLAGLPLTLNLLAERGLDHFRKPEDRVVQRGGGEAEHLGTAPPADPYPAAAAAAVSAGRMRAGRGLWWVTRRLYGNLGGYTALALYCFSPPVLKACVAPTEMLAALGVYGGVYTCIGVAHAMQGPRRKWRPRIVLLTAPSASRRPRTSPRCPLPRCSAWLDALGGRRPPQPGVARGAGRHGRRAVLVFACYGFSPDAFSYLFRSAAGFLWFSLDPARRFFSTCECGRHSAAAASLVLYLGLRRSRYFGNTAPLLCALVCCCWS